MMAPDVVARLRLVLDGYKKVDVCSAVGISDGTLRKALHGRASLDVLSSICRTYEVRLDWLVYGVGARTRSSEVERIAEQIAPQKALQSVASYANELERRLSSLYQRALAVSSLIEELEKQEAVPDSGLVHDLDTLNAADMLHVELPRTPEQLSAAGSTSEVI